MKNKHSLRKIIVTTLVAYLIFYLYLLLIENVINPMLNINARENNASLGGIGGLSKIFDGLIIFMIYQLGAAGLAVFGALTYKASIPVCIWSGGILFYCVLLILYCPNIITSYNKISTIIANVIVLFLSQILPYLAAKFILLITKSGK